jgi:hypothetical protein
MENSFQTSFIPKKSIVTTTSSTVVRTSSGGLFTILSAIILVIVGLTAGGLFLYKNFLIKQKAELSSSLLKVKDHFDKDTISELQLFDKRIAASKEILSAHTVFSPVFSLLADLTIPAVQYTRFSESVGDKGFFVTISGVALDYKSVALQANAFNGSKGRYFKDVVFSNLNRDTSGSVSFDLSFSVDPALLSYEKNNLLEQASSVSAGSQPAAPAQPKNTP